MYWLVLHSTFSFPQDRLTETFASFLAATIFTALLTLSNAFKLSLLPPSAVWILCGLLTKRIRNDVRHILKIYSNLNSLNPIKYASMRCSRRLTALLPLPGALKSTSCSIDCSHMVGSSDSKGQRKRGFAWQESRRWSVG